MGISAGIKTPKMRQGPKELTDTVGWNSLFHQYGNRRGGEDADESQLSVKEGEWWQRNGKNFFKEERGTENSTINRVKEKTRPRAETMISQWTGTG